MNVYIIFCRNEEGLAPDYLNSVWCAEVFAKQEVGRLNAQEFSDCYYYEEFPVQEYSPLVKELEAEYKRVAQKLEAIADAIEDAKAELNDNTQD